MRKYRIYFVSDILANDENEAMLRFVDQLSDSTSVNDFIAEEVIDIII